MNDDDLVRHLRERAEALPPVALPTATAVAARARRRHRTRTGAAALTLCGARASGLVLATGGGAVDRTLVASDQQAAAPSEAPGVDEGAAGPVTGDGDLPADGPVTVDGDQPFSAAASTLASGTLGSVGLDGPAGAVTGCTPGYVLSVDGTTCRPTEEQEAEWGRMQDAQAPLVALIQRLFAAGLVDGTMTSPMSILPGQAGITIAWKGPLPPAVEPVIAEARAAGIVVEVVEVSHTNVQLEEAAMLLLHALQAAGIEASIAFSTLTGLAVEGPLVSDSADLQAQALDIAAHTIGDIAVTFAPFSGYSIPAIGDPESDVISRPWPSWLPLPEDARPPRYGKLPRAV